MGVIKLKKTNEEVVEESAKETLQAGEARQSASERKVHADLPKEALFENEGKKNAYQNVFKFNDGTMRQFISSTPKNYVDKDTNKYRKIESCLCKNAEGDLECQKNIFETKFYSKAENGKIYSMQKNNCGVTLVAEDAGKSDVIIEQLNDETNNKAILKNARSGVDIEYEVESNRIKENIIVRERQENYTFDFDIDLTNLEISVAEDYKSLDLKSKETGEIVFKIPGPVMFDANGEYSDLVSYEIEEKNDALAIKVVADAEYFDAPERAFPVTIDPQVVVNADEITSYQVYRKMRGSSGYTYNWNTTTSQYIRVSRDDSYDYRTTIKIDKSKIGLLDSTISSVKLRLKKYSVSQYGYILVNGSLVYMGSSDIVADITNTFKMYTDTAEFGITIEPNTGYVYGLFYGSGSSAPELEIEYFGNNDKPLLKRFSLAGTAEGIFNAGTGELVTSFETVSAKDLNVNYGISHVYKQSSTDFGLGDNWRLNLHESFIKNYSSCDYTDPSGRKIAFSEYYYYVDDDNNRQYVLKGSVVASIDGQLTCQVGGKIYEVQTEYRSSTGLKVMTKLENVTNAELVEQRSDELKQLENQVKSYKNALDDYVLINMNTYDISSDEPISESKYNALKNPSYCCLVLPHSEALQYMGLKQQRSTYYMESMSNYMPGVKESGDDNTLNRKGGIGYTQLFSLENSFAVLNNQLIEYMDNTTEDNAPNMESVKAIINEGRKEIIADTQFYNKIVQTEEYEFYYNEANKKIWGSDLVDMFYQRNLLVKQLQEAEDSVKAQVGLLDEQIELIESKRDKQIEQFKDYYKEYVNLKYKLDQTKKHMPVNYVTDGTLYKGFNEYGNLVVIFDSYENALNIEYADSLSGTKRIKRVYDGENKTITFEYNSDGRLTEITDARGRNTKFSYNAATVVNGTETADDSDRLGKVEASDGRIIEFKYIQDSASGKYEIYEVTSNDRLKTRLSYASDKLSSMYDYSLASSIKNGEVTESGELSIGYRTVSYTEVTTTIVDQDGNKEKYLFGDDEFVMGELVEKGGKVVSAEMYDYVPYEKNNIQYAKKDTLNKYALTSFDFVAGDTESTTLNAFNNPTQSVTNARKLNTSGTNTQTTTVDYTYDENQKLTKEKTTVVYTNPAKTVVSYKKYLYNVYGDIIRTESCVEGEEETTGKSIEETVYDEKGNVIKSFTYNSLDTSSKFYTESEYSENGQVLADVDETGENKTKYEYIDGTSVVRTQTLPNGSKFSYGHDIDDTVTAITQSTEAGEENSNQTSYTCGLVTEVRSGNNVVQYAYEAKRRMSSVNLNGTENYVQYAYADKATETINGVSKTVNKVTATYTPRIGTVPETFATIEDLRGNVLKTSYNGTTQTEYTYTTDNKLESMTDNISGRTITYVYDSLDRVTSYTDKLASNNTIMLTETHTYNDDGTLASRAIMGEVTQTYGYVYKANAAHDLDYFTVGELKVSPKTDCLGRSTGKAIAVSNEKVYEEIITYRKVGDHATNMPGTIRYGDKQNGTFGIRDSLKYTYDEMGNISKVYENGDLSVRYTYDKLSRLVREDNKAIGETYLFDYDNNGNILNKRTMPFTLKSKEETEELNSTAKEYTYDGDKLLSYNGESFAYDGLGNPTTYRGRTATWEKGRQLKTLVNENGQTVTFTYDGQGRRSSKQSNGETMSFTYGGDGKLLMQRNAVGSVVMKFIYDENGIAGVEYQGECYAYRKDILGNITGIVDKNGKIVVKYTYDAFGNHAVQCLDKVEGKEVFRDVGEAISTEYLKYRLFANYNPFRYRGYYYDVETGLYFLKTRYYDPEIGRFITIDDISYLAPDTINGLNLYAYCGNNPVMRVDPSGQFFLTAFLVGLIVGTIIGAVVGGVYAGVTAYNNGLRGWELVGAIYLGVNVGSFIGGVIGGAIGAIIGVAAPAIASFLGSSFTIGTYVTATGELVAVTVTGSQIAAAGLAVALGIGLVFAKLPYNGGPSNGTLSNDNSIGYYDENGNLTERTDLKGRPHFIKELGEYRLPHTHHYRWDYIKEAWRIIREWVTAP